MKRKRVGIRTIKVGEAYIALDVCWGTNHVSLKHVHQVECADPSEIDNEVLRNIIQKKLCRRFCRQCVINYPLNSTSSRAFYQVVRLNGNRFQGNLPMELIYKIYKMLLKTPFHFTECSKAL